MRTAGKGESEMRKIVLVLVIVLLAVQVVQAAASVTKHTVTREGVTISDDGKKWIAEITTSGSISDLKGIVSGELCKFLNGGSGISCNGDLNGENSYSVKKYSKGKVWVEIKIPMALNPLRRQLPITSPRNTDSQ